jgi:FKBP-type peptidyl-prolyl cis-trans isomerase
MKLINSLIVFGIITLSACTLEGVKDSNHVTTNDTTIIIKEKIKESLNLSALKIDTLEDGNLNKMVWNGENGLRIEWDNKNSNNKIELHDVIMVNYEARVARGDIYDSNSEIGFPVALKTGIGQLIEGWEIALLEMHNGDKGRIMIPSKLAYGTQGLLGVIPQNSDIIVEIEIISIVEAIELENGVKVYKYETTPEGVYPHKNETIVFDYFAFKTGKKPGLYDNSYENGNPFSFRFENDNVIEGLHIGFSQIRAHEKAFIHIPSKMAYGSKGLVDLVPSNTDIIFDVRVESIK